MPMHLIGFSLAVGLLACASQSLSAPASKSDSGTSKKETAGSTFGFTGPETYPIDPFISQLRAADLDGDGLNDLIIVNNSRSKITLLYNQTGKTNLARAHRITDAKRELNELPPDARFRIDSIASEK